MYGPGRGEVLAEPRSKSLKSMAVESSDVKSFRIKNGDVEREEIQVI